VNKLNGADLAFNGACAFVTSTRNRKAKRIKWVYRCQRCYSKKEFAISKYGEEIAHLLAVNEMETHSCTGKNDDVISNNSEAVVT
jgi:hypothetical protein